MRRAVETCLDSKGVDRVIVSTDDRFIAEEATSSGAQVVFRPAEISGDVASSESAVIHVLETLADSGESLPELTLLVQCTSPFTMSNDLDRLIEAAATCDSAFTSVPSHVFLWKPTSDDSLTGVNHNESERLPRQMLEPEFAESGNAYVMRTESFLHHRHRFFGKIGTVTIDPTRALEIDTPTDLELARALASVVEQTRKPGAEELQQIRAVVFDFDGVLTDDSVIVDEDGRESVIAHRGDGLGIGALRAAGYSLLILSKEQNPVVAARALKLGVEVVQGCDDKKTALVAWLDVNGISSADCAYVGNDVNDLEAMVYVGLPVCPIDARPEVQAVSRWVLSKPGGRGAARELADTLLSAVAQKYA